jgi:predicted unusual protein kinase regulating ubiquinone biosynthesis (AarF/ABC1/UbiB family)
VVVDVADRVLVSEWVGGTPVGQLARNGGQAQRDRAGLLLIRFLLSSPIRVGRLHGDPHPGNFRLLDDGRLAVIDFGSSLEMRHGWPARLGQLLRAGCNRDSEELIHVALRSGLVPAGVVTAAALLDFVDPLVEPLRHEVFEFSRGWLRQLAARASNPRSSASRTQRRLRIPVQYLLVQRVAAGTAGVLCLLASTVPVRAEAARWLPELALDDDRPGHT